MNRFECAPFVSLSDALVGTVIARRLILSFCLIWLVGTAATAQQLAGETVEPPSGPNTRQGIISGRVLAEDGRPLANATVYVSGVNSVAPVSPQTATTDDEGKFQVSNLTAGVYMAHANLPGYAALSDPWREGGDGKYYRLGDTVDITMTKGAVITGTVKDSTGEPVVAVSVRAFRLRDAGGRLTSRVPAFSYPRMTDDRGIYRLYGLQPGSYIVIAGGGVGIYGLMNTHEGDAPTYFPSATRDTAVEVTVRSGEEATNIDIRYRGERGNTISGVISGVSEAGRTHGVSVSLRQRSSNIFEATTFVQPGASSGFSFSGVADGEYEVTAQQQSIAGESSASPPLRVSVKGADVTGLRLALGPMASISGKAFLEQPPKEGCLDKRGATFIETLITSRRDEKVEAKETSPFSFFSAGSAVPDGQGDFKIRNLSAGTYRINARLPADLWYVRAINLPGQAVRAASSSRPGDTKGVPTPALLTLRASEGVTGVNITIAQDGATLRGSVTSAAEGALPPNLKVYLVPVERERSEDLLRYSETQPNNDGAFSFSNLAPGRYWLVAQPTSGSELLDASPRPLAWDGETRSKLRREAETANLTIELKPCQRISNYALKYETAK